MNQSEEKGTKTVRAFKVIACETCTRADTLIAMCLHCRRFHCGEHWGEHTCEEQQPEPAAKAE